LIDTTDQKQYENELQLLSNLGAVLVSTLDYAATVEAFARILVPELADLLKVDLLNDDGHIERFLVRFADPDKQQALAEKIKQFSPRPEWKTPQAQVIETGEPMLLTEIPDALRDRMAHDREHADLLRAAGIRSMMVVPLAVRGRTFGAMTFAAAESGRSYSASNFRLAETIAGRIATTIDNVRLFAERKKAIAARDAILAVVSHDLRNSINVIHLKTYLMLQSPSAQSRSDGAFIQRRADEMGRLIQDLLDISSIESGKLRLEKSRQFVAPMVKKVLETFEFEAAEKLLKLEAEVQAESLVVDCDPDRIQQVLMNLLGNAMKFTAAGGTIKVRVGRRQDDVCFSVTDSGQGIPQSDLNHVFDRFWRAVQGGQRGAGLGLSIVKGLVESHGGRIWAESSLGVGSTFFFTLPLAGSESEQPAMRPETGLAGQAQAGGDCISHSNPWREVVLVVDDDADQRDALGKTLEKEGFEVITRRNGAEALDYLRHSKPPFCVLLDITMPVMDGWEFLKERNRDPELNAIPVVVFSGDDAIKKRVLAEHARYLQKPISRTRLNEAMQAGP
jgi:signal transduction histidine kinase/CheY-like chemotaxis protein